MNLAGRCVRTFHCILLKKRNVNDIPQLHARKVFCAVRLFASYRLRQDDDDSEITNKSRGKLTRKETFSVNLRRVYDCTEEQIETIIKESRKVTDLYPTIVARNAECLKQNGLHVNNLVSYPWVLGYDPQLLPGAVKLLEAFHSDINVSIPFLIHPFKKLTDLNFLVVQEKEGSRVKWLSELMEYDEQGLSQFIAKYTFMLTIPRDRILLVVDILKGGGVAPQSIARDLSIFRYDPKKISERCNKVQEAGIDSIKPWIIRCSEWTFNRMIEKRVRNKELLGHKSAREYLAERLECSDDTVSYIIKKIPQLKYISGVKIKELLDFLYEVGYSPSEVCQGSRILTRSVRTVKARFIQLQGLRSSKPGVLVLCKTNKEYKEYLEKIKKGRSLMCK